MPEDLDGVADSTRTKITPLDIIRTLVLIASLASLAVWGFSMWSFPWGLILGIGAPAVMLVVWALFLSPRSMLPLHPFVRVLVELLIYAGVTLAWWSMGQPWIGIAFAVVAVTTGLIAGRKNLQ